jgi:hypothetical protein
MSDDDNLDEIKMEYSSGNNKPFAIPLCRIHAFNKKQFKKVIPKVPKPLQWYEKVIPKVPKPLQWYEKVMPKVPKRLQWYEKVILKMN